MSDLEYEEGYGNQKIGGGLLRRALQWMDAEQVRPKVVYAGGRGKESVKG